MDKHQLRQVAFGFLGSTLDQGPRGSKRWDLWRPTVGICQQEDLLIDRLELFYVQKFAALAKQVADDIASVAPETAVVHRVLEIEDSWDFEEVYGALLDFAQGYRWSPDEEEYLLHITTGTHVAQICMFLLAEARYFPAKLLQSSPPAQGEKDPRGTYRIIDLDLSKYDKIASRFHRAQRESLSVLKSGIATRNTRFNALIAEVEHVALRSRDPVLLLGPTGVGKSQLARRIYELKRSRNQVQGAFVDVNCATIRGDGAMSALFGHLKGSFTGASGAREGLLRAADRGILFLDEIGELGLDEQAMLLRAVEDRTFLPVGSDRPVQSDFQLIAGTNRDLLAEVQRGLFRDDLLARINLWSFSLPPLSDRREDIEPNLDYELDRYAEKHGKVTFNREARDAFLKFAVSPDARWKSNFRDLNAAVVRMATLAEGGRITVQVVNQEIARLRHLWRDTIGPNVPAPGPPDEQTLAAYFGLQQHCFENLDQFDRVQLLEVLRVCRDAPSLAEAGRTLFAVSRREKSSINDADRLRKYLARFGVIWRGRRAG